MSDTPCSGCGGPLVSTDVVAPWRILAGRTIPVVQSVSVSACWTCDRARCPNAGCRMPTGPLLAIRRDLTPSVCDHCGGAVTYPIGSWP